MKAEQAQEVARKAAADAEIAMSTARQYSPTHSQPGAPRLLPRYCIAVSVKEFRKIGRYIFDAVAIKT